MEERVIGNKVIEKKIVLIGLANSGKTLYLSCLKKAVNNDGYNFDGKDDPISVGGSITSAGWLLEREKNLQKGELPMGTSGYNDLEFVISGEAEEFILKSRDRKGDDYNDPKDELLDYLSDCDAYILLFDLLDDFNRQKLQYEHLFGLLRNRIKNKSIGKRLSVCLTKADDPEFIDWLTNQPGLPLPQNGPRDLSALDAREVFVNKFAEADIFANLLDKRFGKFHWYTDCSGQEHYLSNVNYYCISSIGFYEDEDQGGLISSNFSINENGQGRLKNGGAYQPVNLLPPLIWAIGVRPQIP